MSLSNVRLGLIGAGAMSSAIIRGLIDADIMKPNQITATDLNGAALKALSDIKVNVINTAEDKSGNQNLVANSDVVILAVKPQVVDTVLSDIKGKFSDKNAPLIISIAAGIQVEAFAKHLPKHARLVRVMPNVNCMIGEAASAYCLALDAKKGTDDVLTETIFSSVGKIVQVTEKLLDAVTGLSGSGPAYVFQFIEALSDGGVRSGLPRDVATLLAAQTVYGSAKMVLQGKYYTGQLKDMVTSPGGTTIAGLHALEQGGMRGIIMNAVYSATNRSEELGKPLIPSKL
ncbi:pyrroline-5-carboxylate reductase ProC [Acrasis kona]|uniref:Pyrroline-5-carboxylate reductase ProC n=1 Tax=Acrasis kona TaxID=1008807 RepID=A0AAW2ZI94_9EUKA